MGIPVAVLGDYYVDSILFDLPSAWRQDLRNLDWLDSDPARSSILVRRKGGALLVAEMLAEYVDGRYVDGKGGSPRPSPLVDCFSYNVDDPSDPSKTWPLEALCRMAPFPLSPGSKSAYRVKQFLGWLIREGTLHPIENDLVSLIQKGWTDKSKPFSLCDCLAYVSPEQSMLSASLYQPPQIVAIVDQNRGFRNIDEKVLQVLLDGTAANYVWQLDIADPKSLDSTLAKVILPKLQDRTIVITKSEHLRKIGIQLKQDESIETIMEEFDRALRNPRFRPLVNCRAWIVWLDEGALLFDKQLETISCITCPEANSAGMDAQQDSARGGFAIVTAAVTLGIAVSLEKKLTDGEELKGGIRLGTLFQVLHYFAGYANGDFLATKHRNPSDELPRAPYPFRELFRKTFRDCIDDKDLSDPAKWKTKSDRRLAELTLRRMHPCISGSVSRVQIYLENHATSCDAKFKKAIDIVVNGQDAELAKSTDYTRLGNRWLPEAEILCPVATFGKVRSVFRQEIEGYTSVEGLIRNYLKNDGMKAPLCLATFGRPGSGKSLAVKQITRMIDPKSEERTLEFNVAQFDRIDDLAAAFHQVHDRAIGASPPLVIFDEFDCDFESRELGWLKYFLAPMNDGKFRDERTVYNVGRAIFLFAGGTTESFEEFDRKRQTDPKAQATKLPDFISRLRGHLNILGINSPGDQPVDDGLLFRRAVLLRSLLEAHSPNIIDKNDNKATIDRELVFALLCIPAYKHGGRSIQAILEMAAISQEEHFKKASLPLSHQLDMHVDAERFINLMASATGI